MLTIDVARQARSTAAGVESLRNETNASVRTNTAIFSKIADAVDGPRVQGPHVTLIERPKT